MSSLWTPAGEHKVPRLEDRPEAPEEDRGRPFADDGAGRRAQGPRKAEERPARGAPSRDDLSEEELAALTAELAAAPVADVIANHCFGLFELAALHLSGKPPRLEEARLAIDALGAIVDGLGPRLGGSSATLGEALTQIRLAFVKISDGPQE